CRAVCLPNELIAVLVGYASSAGNYPVCGPCTLACGSCAHGPVFSLRQKERKRRGRKDHTQYESKHKPNENRCSEKEGTVLPFWSQGSLWPICQYVVHSLTSKIAYNGCHVPAISEKVEGPFRDSKSCLVLNSACKERSR